MWVWSGNAFRQAAAVAAFCFASASKTAFGTTRLMLPSTSFAPVSFQDHIEDLLPLRLLHHQVDFALDCRMDYDIYAGDISHEAEEVAEIHVPGVERDELRGHKKGCEK